MKYELKMPINPTDRDNGGQLKMSALLYFAQEAAGAHAETLGAGWDALQEKGLFWAVIRTRAEILAQPTGNEVIIKTWPMPTSRTAYPRCVMGYDQDGTLLFKLVSLWVLMDIKTRAMVLPGKSGVEVLGTLYGDEPEQPRGLPVNDQEQVVYKTVEQCHLDVNGHMNNTRYMDWVMELAENRPVQKLELCYFNEGILGDQMEIGFTKNNDAIQVAIHHQRTDGTDKKDRIFAAQVQYSVNQFEN